MRTTFGFCLLATAAAVAYGVAAPAPAPRPQAHPGNVVRGLSMDLRATHQKVSGFPNGLHRLDVVILNTGPKTTFADAPFDVVGFLEDPRVLFLVRTASGSVISARRVTFFSGSPQGGGPKPLTLDAGRTLSGSISTFDLRSGSDEPFKVPLDERICVTVIVPALGLRSNTVFCGGRFPLPANFDPLGDHREFLRRRDVADEQRRERFRR